MDCKSEIESMGFVDDGTGYYVAEVGKPVYKIIMYNILGHIFAGQTEEYWTVDVLINSTMLTGSGKTPRDALLNLSGKMGEYLTKIREVDSRIQSMLGS